MNFTQGILIFDPFVSESSFSEFTQYNLTLIIYFVTRIKSNTLKLLENNYMFVAVSQTKNPLYGGDELKTELTHEKRDIWNLRSTMKIKSNKNY